VDGWWKGIAYETAFHLRQEGDRLLFRASADRVKTHAGEMPAPEFLRWYLRIEEPPRIRASREDTHLRRARRRLTGIRFVRQDPFECLVSYVLSVQAHMTLTKRRVNFLALILGRPVELSGERYWTFPDPASLADLNGAYFRSHRFGWRSDWIVAGARYVTETLPNYSQTFPESVGIPVWRDVVDEIRSQPGTGVGLKVGKCIDLFALERLGAVPVDTWVRKLARDWYGVTGSDARICAWAEDRGGTQAGYVNEYLFAYYRELNAPSIHDRVVSFCASDLASSELPFERI
jgi:N-glycosylase/DNA lyase